MTDNPPAVPEPEHAFAEHLPDKVKESILNLNPRQAAAVRLYTQRGGPGYGNKAKSCRLAGYSDNTDPAQVFNQPGVKNALSAIREMQAEHAKGVMMDIAALAPDAKEELQSQLELGRGLDIIDPRDIFGDSLENLSADNEARLKEINRHNRNMAHLAKERRAAAETLLAYSEGTPEQRVRMTKEADDDDVMRLLMQLSDEEFEEMGKRLFGDDVRVVRDAGKLEIEGDYEIVEEENGG